MLKKWLALLCFTAFAGAAAMAAAAGLPYDERADAEADVARALQQARADQRHVLLVFGANWCPDCREFDRALDGKSAALVAARFIVVKVDVGNFDRNSALVNAYGNPIRKGIPAAVLLTPDNQVLYATRGGELADARRMGDHGIYGFLSAMAARHPASRP